MALMREMPVKRADQMLGESGSRMWRMHFGHLKAAHVRLCSDSVVWVGPGKVNRREGNKYLTVFAELLAMRERFVPLEKDASVWAAIAEELLQHNGHPKAIRHLAIEMSIA